MIIGETYILHNLYLNKSSLFLASDISTSRQYMRCANNWLEMYKLHWDDPDKTYTSCNFKWT